METERLEMVYMELKYCERCGGLWFRRKGEPQVYCEPCSLQWPEIAGVDDEPGVSYARLKRGFASDRRMIDFVAVCPQEGKV